MRIIGIPGCEQSDKPVCDMNAALTLLLFVHLCTCRCASPCPFCHVSLSCILCLYRSLTLSFFPPSCMLCSLAHSLFIYSRHSARVHTCTHTRFLSQTSVCLSESISDSHYAVTHRLDAKEAAEGSKQYAVKRSSVELLWNKTESFVKFVA